MRKFNRCVNLSEKLSKDFFFSLSLDSRLTLCMPRIADLYMYSNRPWRWRLKRTFSEWELSKKSLFTFQTHKKAATQVNYPDTGILSHFIVRHVPLFIMFFWFTEFSIYSAKALKPYWLKSVVTGFRVQQTTNYYGTCSCSRFYAYKKIDIIRPRTTVWERKKQQTIICTWKLFLHYVFIFHVQRSMFMNAFRGAEQK